MRNREIWQFWAGFPMATTVRISEEPAHFKVVTWCPAHSSHSMHLTAPGLLRPGGSELVQPCHRRCLYNSSMVHSCAQGSSAQEPTVSSPVLPSSDSNSGTSSVWGFIQLHCPGLPITPPTGYEMLPSHPDSSLALLWGWDGLVPSSAP